MQFQPITPDIARMYRLPVEWGPISPTSTAGSPADQAGLQQGDIITRIGEITLDDTNSYINALFQFKPGELVTLEVIRQDSRIELQVTLGEFVKRTLCKQSKSPTWKSRPGIF